MQVSLGGSSPGLCPQDADTVSSLCPHTVVPLCVCVSQSHKDTSPAGLAHPRDLTLPYLCKGPVSKCSPIPRSWGSGLQHVNVGDAAQPKRGALAALGLGGSDHPSIWLLASLGSRIEQGSHLHRGQVSDLRRSQAIGGSRPWGLSPRGPPRALGPVLRAAASSVEPAREAPSGARPPSWWLYPARPGRSPVEAA